ncbi:hypothetical protein AX016_2374 [Cellulophaga sp. RHA19]|uniref:hypothetical protein n=1 Tax=Cellulophaga sp. RHA19 TaxID=1798237 RepID=UPI000C2CA58C|nr:hypothetical protein [Cellulophaga sp. RHA19]PKB44160.1 hypothetical protein AX016_2374 [Cellulophaga sp. RHA19]
MNKTIRNNKAKNKILKYLTKDFKYYLIFDVSKNENIDEDLTFVCAEELERLEFIDIMDVSTQQGPGIKLKLTRKGSLFLKDGGFPFTKYEVFKLFIKNHKTTIISILALILSIINFFIK